MYSNLQVVENLEVIITIAGFDKLSPCYEYRNNVH